MKSIGVVILTSLFLFGGALSQQVQPAQQATKAEIAESVDGLFRGLETLNVDTLFQWYTHSSDFVLFTTDGSMADYQAAREHHVAWFKQLAALKVSTTRKEIRVQSPDQAVCAWRGAFDMTFTSGGQAHAEFAITFLLTRSGSKWMVVYQQTAQLPTGQQSKTK